LRYAAIVRSYIAIVKV